MATLNDVEFGIISKSKSISHDNIITDIPGSDTVVVDDLGYSTDPMVITGHVKNETEFDSFKEEYYSGGALTLIVNPDSGKQYTVYALRNVTETDGSRTYPLTDIIFTAVFQMQTPYLESTSEVTRSKSITTQNQEWSADDDGASIATLGNVDAVPDIQVAWDITQFEFEFVSEDVYSALGPGISGLTWDGTNIWSCDSSTAKIYKHNSDLTLNTEYAAPGTYPTGLTWDGTHIWSCDAVSDKIYKHNSDMTVNTEYAAPSTFPYGLACDGVNIWSCDYSSDKIYKHNADMTVNATYDTPSTYISGLTWDGTNIWSCDYSTDLIYKHNADMTVDSSYAAPSTIPKGLAWDGSHIWSCDSYSDKIYKHYSVDSTVSSTLISQTDKL